MSRGRPRTSLVAFLVLAVAFVALGLGRGGPDTRAIKPLATTKTLPSPRSLVATGGAVWFATPTGVERVNPATSKVTATVEIPSDCCPSIAAGPGVVWAASFDENVVRRIDPATNRVTATIKAGPTPRGSPRLQGRSG